MHTDIEDTDYLFDATTEKEENIIVIENPSIGIRLVMFFIKKPPFKDSERAFITLYLMLKNIVECVIIGSLIFIIFFLVCFLLGSPFLGRGFFGLCYFIGFFCIGKTFTSIIKLKSTLVDYEKFKL